MAMELSPVILLELCIRIDRATLADCRVLIAEY
jgi:hypothetical protein